MRAYDKKKAYRAGLKRLARDGFINKPDGNWAPRNSGAVQDNAMKRDFYPQRG